MKVEHIPGEGLPSKQDRNAPVPVELQVCILYAVTHDKLTDVAVENVRQYEMELYDRRHDARVEELALQEYLAVGDGDDVGGDISRHVAGLGLNEVYCPLLGLRHGGIFYGQGRGRAHHL